MTDNITDDDVAMVYENYPVDGVEAIIKTVNVGPIGEDFVILIEFNPLEGPLRVTVGNGPTHEEAPTIVAKTLRDVADAIEDLQDMPEYWTKVREISTEE